MARNFIVASSSGARAYAKTQTQARSKFSLAFAFVLVSRRACDSSCCKLPAQQFYCTFALSFPRYLLSIVIFKNPHGFYWQPYLHRCDETKLFQCGKNYFKYLVF